MDKNLNEFDIPGTGSGNNNNDNNQKPSGPGSGGNDPKKQSIILFLIASLITLVLVSSFMRMLSGSTVIEIPYNEFLRMLDAGEVVSVVIGSDRITITPVNIPMAQQQFSYGYSQPSQVTYYTGKVEDDDTLTARLLQYGKVEIKGQVTDNSQWLLSLVLSYVLPILMMWALLSFLFRRMSKGGGPFNVGKSNAKIYVQKDTGITFADVAGEDEAKESLQEVVDFLHNPGRYAKIGAKLPKGALLVGPPGTGKTLLAKAVAGEAHVPFFSLSGSDFIEMYVGVGASRVRDLFKDAGKNAPCIIFIDEIDAIGRSRDNKFGGGHEEREQTLNQLLSEMDGFDTSKGVLILGATNRPEILDKALLRPGRFDRRIIVDKPDLRGRVEILKVHAKDVAMDETVDLDAIALATSGAVGADLANMINEAAINAVQRGRDYVTQKDLFDAVEQVLVGKEKKDRIMSKEERKIVSYHEVGHALVSALQKNSEPVQKITIVPRTMGALGYVMHVPEEEKYLQTKAELHDRLVSLLAGRAAEELVFDTVTTGAANDIEQATNIVRNMITRFGMSKKFGLMGLATVESEYLGGGAHLTCADVTAAEIDAEIMTVMKACYDEAKELLSGNRELMDELADYLIEKETISGKEFMKIYREAKGLPEPEPEKEGKENTEKRPSLATKEEKLQEEIKEKTDETKLGSVLDVTIDDDYVEEQAEESLEPVEELAEESLEEPAEEQVEESVEGSVEEPAVEPETEPGSIGRFSRRPSD